MVRNVLAIGYLLAPFFLSQLVQPSNCQTIPLASWIYSWFEHIPEVPYVLIRKIQDNVEEREYASRQWICIEEFATPERFEEKHKIVLQNLMAYRKQMNLPITVPLSMKVDHRNGALFSYETCLHILEEVQFKTKPVLMSARQKVKVYLRPKLKVFSLQFGGYATPSIFEQKFEELSNILKNQTLRFDEFKLGTRALHFRNIYSSSIKFWNRRNEIWLLSEQNASKYLQQRFNNNKL